MNNEEVVLRDKNQYKKWMKICLYSIIFLLFLTPSFKLVESLPKVRLEEIFIIFILLVFLIRVIYRKYILLAFNSTIGLLVIFCFLIGFSILNGTVQGYQTSIFDFNQFIMVFKYGVIYTVALTFYYLNKDNANEMNALLHFIFFMAFLLFLIVIQQYFNLFGLNEAYVHFIAPTQFDTLVDGYSHPRPVGMIGNPNELGFFFVMVGLLALFILFNRKFKLVYLVILILQIAGVFLTLSRTSLIAFVVGALIVLVSTMISRKNDVKKFVRILILFLILFLVTIYVVSSTDFLDQIWWRFSEIFNLENSTSWNARLNNWSENMEIFLKHVVLGVGPLSRAILQHAADNEWLLLLRSYGVIGTIAVSLIFIYLSWVSKLSFKGLIVSIVFAGGVYMISSVFFQSLVLMPFFLILAAINNSVTKVMVVTR
jgi:hypothetical protein